jgi:hypothetical protein
MYRPMSYVNFGLAMQLCDNDISRTSTHILECYGEALLNIIKCNRNLSPYFLQEQANNACFDSS